MQFPNFKALGVTFYLWGKYWRVFSCVVIPQVPGQTPGQARKDENQENKSGAQQAPSKPKGSPSGLDSGKPPDSKGGRGDQKQKDDPISVSTVKPLDVRADVAKDWMDRLNWVLTLVLLLIGVFGVWYARKTLVVIEGQLKEIQAARAQTDKMLEHAAVQAEAARLNSEAVIRTERAWVLVRPVQDMEWRPIGPGAVRPYNQFRVFMTNRGKTVARLARFQAGGYLVNRGEELPETPTYEFEEGATFGSDGISIHNTGVLAPEEPNVMAMGINLPLDAYKIEQIRLGDLIFYAFGRIEYFDFSEKPRVVQFCYAYADSRDIDGKQVKWLLAGPAAYNTHT